MRFWSKGSGVEADQIDAPDEPTPEAPRWIGYIDKIDRAVIHGWCYDRREPEQSLAVEALGSKGSRIVVIACLFRQDVKDGGYGSGHLGFELDLSSFDDSETVTVRFADSLVPITSAPIALDPISALCTNALPERFLEAARQLALHVDRLPADERESRADPDEAYDDRLLATFDPPSDPEGLITRFLAQESHRIVRDAFDLEMTGSFQERLGVLLWYIDDYAATRPPLARVPLSERQIAALNTAAPIAGAMGAVTVALQNFVLRHLPSHANLRDQSCLIEAVYWWCVERAPRTRLADRLVTRDQVDLLCAPGRGAGTLYPCTSFMTLYAQRHAELGGLDLDVPRDRLALLCYLFLAGIIDPFLLRYLPREPLRRLLRVTDGRSAIDPILARLASKDGGEIRRIGRQRLAAADRDAARSGAVPRPAAANPGVGIVGPYEKSSGLGRAMRLSLEVLETAEAVRPALLDFGMENPAPGGGDGAALGAVALDAPREITLLHLNAETVPLAFAYGPPGLLAGSYCIGFFFWELNEIPQCQRLALDLVDEVWVASEFNRELYARHTGKPVIRVGMAAPRLPDVTPVSRGDFGLDPGAFVFVASFDSFSFIGRKNPLAAIEAFRRAFPLGSEPVQLLVKTQNRGRVGDGWQVRTWRRIDRALAADPRIVLVDETLAFTELLALTRACDAYVSLHRAEGWGFGLVEAMQLGLPVICTGYSGNADFCTPETTFLVEHSLIAVAPDEYIYVPRGSVWADPSIASAAAQMRHVVADRPAAARKADAAKAFVATHLSKEATARRYAERLAAIRGEVGNGKAAT